MARDKLRVERALVISRYCFRIPKQTIIALLSAHSIKKWVKYAAATSLALFRARPFV